MMVTLTRPFGRRRGADLPPGPRDSVEAGSAPLPGAPPAPPVGSAPPVPPVGPVPGGAVPGGAVPGGAVPPDGSTPPVGGSVHDILRYPPVEAPRSGRGRFIDLGALVAGVRRLLPGSGSGGGTQALTPGGQVPAPERGGRFGGRGPLAMAVAGVLVIGLGAVAYLELSGSGGDGASGPVAVATHRATGRAGAPGGSGAGRAKGGATPSGSAAPSGSAGASTAGPTSSRNPFGELAGAASATSTGATSTGATSTSAPTTSVTTGTTATTTASTAPASPAVGTTVTTTETSTVSPIYIGLYGWTSDDLPEFVVGTTGYTPSAGSTFASSFTYVGSATVDDQTCANITYSGTAQQLCPGSVIKEG